MSEFFNSHSSYHHLSQGETSLQFSEISKSVGSITADKCRFNGVAMLCRKPIHTNAQYLRHLAEDVLPVILRRSFEIARESEAT